MYMHPREKDIKSVFSVVTDHAKNLNVEHGVSEEVKKEGRKLLFSPGPPVSGIFVKTKIPDK